VRLLLHHDYLVARGWRQIFPEWANTGEVFYTKDDKFAIEPHHAFMIESHEPKTYELCLSISLYRSKIMEYGHRLIVSPRDLESQGLMVPGLDLLCDFRRERDDCRIKATGYCLNPWTMTRYEVAGACLRVPAILMQPGHYTFVLEAHHVITQESADRGSKDSCITGLRPVQ